MKHLHKLAKQYYEWQGYLVQENVIVGLRKSGKYDGMLDLISYHPKLNRVVQIEFATHYESWKHIEPVMADQFELGRSFIFTEVFPRFAWHTELKQIGILPVVEEQEIDRVPVTSIDKFISEILREIEEQGSVADNGIPEKYDLLRAIQLVTNGYQHDKG